MNAIFFIKGLDWRPMKTSVFSNWQSPKTVDAGNRWQMATTNDTPWLQKVSLQSFLATWPGKVNVFCCRQMSFIPSVFVKSHANHYRRNRFNCSWYVCRSFCWLTTRGMTELVLHEAAVNGEYQQLESMLMIHRIDIDHKDEDFGDRTALHWAASRG